MLKEALTLGSKTKDLIFHSNSSSQSIGIFLGQFLKLYFPVRDGKRARWHLHLQHVVLQGRNPELKQWDDYPLFWKETLLVSPKAVSKLDRCSRGTHHLHLPGLLATQTSCKSYVRLLFPVWHVKMLEIITLVLTTRNKVKKLKINNYS